MKLIIAIIRPEKLTEVKEALSNVGVVSLTVTNVKGRGRQKGIVQQWRGREYCVDLLDKVKIETVVPQELVETAVKVIRESAKTDMIGDGKIFILPVEETVRIRTGEKGHEAIF